MMTSLNSRVINSRGGTSTSRTGTEISVTSPRGGQFPSTATGTIGSVSVRPATQVIHVASRTEVFSDRNGAYAPGLDGKDVRPLSPSSPSL